MATQAWIASCAQKTSPTWASQSHPPHAPRLWSLRSLIAAIRNGAAPRRVLIDLPDVTFRLARELKKNSTSGPSTLSAHSSGLETQPPPLGAAARPRMMSSSHSKSVSTARGVDAQFVGHPLAELPKPNRLREEYAARATEISQDHWFYARPGDGRPVETRA